MKRRVLLLVIGTTVFAVLLVGAAIISAIAITTGDAFEARAQNNARVAAVALDATYAAGGTIDSEQLAALSRDSATLVATLPDGSSVASGPVPEGTVFEGEFDSGEVSVRAVIPGAVVRDRVVWQAAVVLAASLLAVGVATIVALVAGRRMTRPLEELEEAAESLAQGDTRHLARRYGVKEVDAIAEVLERGATAFVAMLEDERRVTAEASHQLRTPLTALSLRLEEILATDDIGVVHDEAVAALVQAERLGGVVDEVARVRRGEQSRQVMDVPVDDLVAGQLLEWRPSYDRAGRVLERSGRRGLCVRATPGAQAQVLATLIENSLAHGAGDTVIRTRSASGWVVLEVSDAGPGIPEDLVARVFDPAVSGAQSSGLGLAVARTLASADEGRLELVSARPATFALFLPEVPPAGSTQADVARVASSAAAGSSGNTHRR